MAKKKDIYIKKLLESDSSDVFSKNKTRCNQFNDLIKHANYNRFGCITIKGKESPHGRLNFKPNLDYTI